MKKIFAPDLMFNDFVSPCWCDNIVTIEGKIPIQKELKSSSIFAMEIIPRQSKTYSAFGLPVNKNWKSENITGLVKPKLMFEAASAKKVEVRIQFQDSEDVSHVKKIVLDETDSWNDYNVVIPRQVLKDLRMIVFSFPAFKGNMILMKNIRID